MPNVEAQRTDAAERMRRYRERKKSGLRCLLVEVHDDEVRELETRGYLPAGCSDDPEAVAQAFYQFLDDTLTPADDAQRGPGGDEYRSITASRIDATS